jgi:hypothetical protein
MLSSHTYKSLCDQTPAGANRKGFIFWSTPSLCAASRHQVVRALCVAILAISLALAAPEAKAQCSVCSRTAQQLGEKPAKSLNKAIVYLMIAPFGIMGFIGFRWWRNEYGKQSQ